MTPNDPTHSGAPVSDHSVRFSRSEIESVCAKAARGAGFPWGLAEEAGVAARLLAEADLPGPELLLAALQATRGSRPDTSGRVWRDPKGGVLCPVMTGAALADWLTDPDWPDAGRVTLQKVGFPTLLLAIALSGAKRGQRRLLVKWNDAQVHVGPFGFVAGGPSEDLSAVEAAEVSIAFVQQDISPVEVNTGRRVLLDAWRALDALAMATTVPATAESRTGAGAASDDND